MGEEREIKLRLTAAEAVRIESACGPPQRVLHQRSDYFDTPQATLHSRRFGLRLRRERSADGRERLWLTLKGAARAEGPLTARLENSVPIDPSDAERLLQGPITASDLTPLFSRGDSVSGNADPGATLESLLQAIRAQGLQSLGALENERRVFEIDLEAGEGSAVVLLEVDRVTFPDGETEHELEVEWPRRAGSFPEEALRRWLSKVGVAWRPESRSKLARLFERRRTRPARG